MFSNLIHPQPPFKNKQGLVINMSDKNIKIRRLRSSSQKLIILKATQRLIFFFHFVKLVVKTKQRYLS